MFVESFRMALRNIKSNKMRSFLTMLGIVIGVAAVIGLVTIVQGVTSRVMDEFSDLGAGMMSVSAPGTALKRGLTESDVETLRAIDGVEGVSPNLSTTGSAVKNREIFDNVTIEGDDLSYFQRNSSMLEEGRIFNASEADGNTYVCMVDKTFVTKVLNGTDPIGQTVRLNGIEYTIIGRLGANNSMMSMSDTSNSDGTVYLPYRNVMHMTGTAQIQSLEVYTKDGADSSAVESALRAALDRIYNNADNAYAVINMESLLSVMDTVSGMLTTMLGGIAAISLLVGGIGIMNMMLVSVSERTKEIGLRKALGAQPYRIQLQFLIESITLSLLGGLIGIILGEITAYAATTVLGTTYSVSYGAIALGAGFSAAVGVIFGWMPARRASALNPIDALRSE